MSSPNVISSTKTIRKTLPSGEVEETVITTRRSPASSSIPSQSQGVCPGAIPRPAGSIPRPTGAIPRPRGGLPRPAGALPGPSAGFARPMGALSRPPAMAQRPGEAAPMSRSPIGMPMSPTRGAAECPMSSSASPRYGAPMPMGSRPTSPLMDPSISAGTSIPATFIPKPTGGIARPSGLQRPGASARTATTGLPRPGIPQRQPAMGTGRPSIPPPAAALPLRSISSKTTIIQPDGSKKVTKKTQLFKSPSRTESPGSARERPAAQAQAPCPGARVPARPMDTLQVPQPVGRVSLPPSSARGSLPPAARMPTAQPCGPSAATGAVRKASKTGMKITHSTTKTGVDAEGRPYKRSKTTVSIKQPPSAAGGQKKPPLRPADVSLLNIQRDPLNQSTLERTVSQDLKSQAARSGQGTAKATKVDKTSAPTMMTPAGQVPVDKQVVVEMKVDRSPEGEQVHRHIITSARQPDDTHQRIELVGQTMSQPDFEAEAAELGVAPHDIVAIQSTTSVGGGYRQKTTKITYETDRPETEDEGNQMEPDEVAKLVEEENKDLEEILHIIPPEIDPEPDVYLLRKKVQNLQLSSLPVEILEKDVEMPQPTGDEELPEMQPELIATIMHTQEEGLMIESQPNRVYNYLFPDDMADKVATASSAAPAVVQDVVVPLTIPAKMNATIMSEELQAATAALHNIAVAPTENAYSETIKTTAPKALHVVKVKRKKVKPIAEEQPPWGIEDMQVIAELVGAEPANPLTEVETDISVEKDPMTQGIDFFVDLQGPAHVSRVQLRGSQNPPWFPGYVVALPTIPDLVRMERSPNTILSSAWRAVQPNVFAEDSFLIL